VDATHNTITVLRHLASLACIAVRGVTACLLASFQAISPLLCYLTVLDLALCLRLLECYNHANSTWTGGLPVLLYCYVNGT